MVVDVTYTFRCAANGCDATDTHIWPAQCLTHARGLPLPALPLGWLALGTLVVCGRHKAQVLVDGQVLLVETPLPF